MVIFKVLFELGIAPQDETQVYFISETPGTGVTGHSLYKYKYLSGNGTGAGCAERSVRNIYALSFKRS